MSTVTPFRKPPKADYQMPEEVEEIIKKAARKATALHWAAFGLQEVGSATDNDFLALQQLAESIENDLDGLLEEDDEEGDEDEGNDGEPAA